MPQQPAEQPAEQFTVPGITDPYLKNLGHHSYELGNAVERLDRTLTPFWENIEDGKTPAQAASEHEEEIKRAKELIARARQHLDAVDQAITF